MRDTQRSKVYSAEQFVRQALDRAASSKTRTVDFYGSTLVIPAERRFGDLASVQRYVDQVLGLNWVRSRWPESSAQAVTVRARKGSNLAHYEYGRAVIAVPDHNSGLSWAMREIVILHEVAHHLTATRGHGPDFAATFLELVAQLIGPEAGLLLTDAYTRHGVDFRIPAHT